MGSGHWKTQGWGLRGDPGHSRSRGVSAGAGREGAAPREPSGETETWAGPGRPAGRAGGRQARGTPGRVLPRAAPRWPPLPPPLRRKPPPTRGPRVRLEAAAEAEASEGRTVPAGWAQPPQGPGE
jgi:hypothetical protein